MQSILDGVTLGATQGAEGDDPAVVEGDHNIEKEVYVTAGQVLVEMHVTDWATAQREDPVLDTLGAKVAYVGLGNAYTSPSGYIIIWVQVDGVLSYDEDQIAQ